MDAFTPIEIRMRPKRGMRPDAPRVHYVLKLASGYCWHSTPEFTGICNEEDAMAGYEEYNSMPIPPENWLAARERLMDELLYPEPWAGNDNCQHKVNWIAFGEKRSPTYEKVVAGVLLTGLVGFAIAADRELR